MADEETPKLFTQISEAQGHWHLSRCDEGLLESFYGCIRRSQNPKRIEEAMCSFSVFHVSYTCNGKDNEFI